MPPLKSSLIKPSRSMLFFHIWNANFSLTPINSQMYMTKPKQVQKNSQKILGKLFPWLCPLLHPGGGGIITEMTVHSEQVQDPGYTRANILLMPMICHLTSQLFNQTHLYWSKAENMTTHLWRSPWPAVRQVLLGPSMCPVSHPETSCLLSYVGSFSRLWSLGSTAVRVV